MKTHTLLAALAAAVTLNAVEIDIKPSATLTVTQPEATAFVEGLKKKRVQISFEEANDVIYENRLLSNEWLKEHELKAYEVDAIRHELEVKLANRLIDDAQEKIKTDDDVLLSYYKVNPKEFTIGDVLSFSAYYFSSYDDAYDFYSRFREDSSKAETYASDNNISVKKRKDMPLLRMDSTLQFIIDDSRSVPYVTVPARFRDTYLVLEVTAFEKDALMPFEKAKKKIRAKLLKKRRQDTRFKLIEALQPAEKK